MSDEKQAWLCATCHWWLCFSEPKLIGDCVWHNGVKKTDVSKMRFKGILKTKADFGCNSWTRDRRDEAIELADMRESVGELNAGMTVPWEEVKDKLGL